MCPVIVPVFKSKKLLRMNGLRTITGHITRPHPINVCGVAHEEAAR
jgi:hypothetical protein